MTSIQRSEQQDNQKKIDAERNAERTDAGQTDAGQTDGVGEAIAQACATAHATELEAYNQQLRDRDRLLNCVNLATQRLVAVEDLGSALPDVLEILGVGTQQSRSYILKNVWNAEAQSQEFHLMTEWDAPDIPTKRAAGGRFPIAINTFPDHLTDPLRNGEATQFLARDLDGIGIRDRIDGQALSLMGVPIIVDGHWWGLLGLDDCVAERVWSEAEIAVLKTAATAISSAIERTQASAARAKAEKAISTERERAARNRAAELSRINEAISQTLTALAANPRTDVFLGMLLRELSKQTGACKTHLYLYDAETHLLRQHCTIQDGQLHIGTAPSDPELFSQPIAADAAQTWQMILSSPLPLTFNNIEVLSEVLSDDTKFWAPEIVNWHIREGHQQIACSRMKVGDTPIGYISFAFQDSAALSPVQLEFIQALANQATLSIHLTHLAAQSQNAALNEERNRLAREIHDTLAQAFTGISLQLEAARAMLHTPRSDNKPIESALFRARDLAREGLSEARRSVQALRSGALESDTLIGALRKLLSQTALDTGLSTQLYLEGVVIAIPDDIQQNLLRIAQEATTNVLRHAQATQLEVTLAFIPNSALGDRASQLQLTIADNGVGFEPETLVHNSGFGIVGIRERVARLHGEIALHSGAAEGTTLVVTVPIQY